MSTETTEPPAEAAIPEILPLTVTTKGEIAISSNLSLFRESVERFVAGINLDPKTDLDFGKATEDVKVLQGLNDGIKAKKAELLAEASDLHALLEGLDGADAFVSAARLKLAKAIKEKTEEIKAAILSEGMDALDCAKRHRARFRASVEGAIKRKQTLDSMKKAVGTMVSTLNAATQKSRAAIDDFRKEHGDELIPDAEDLEVESLDKVDAELRRRLEAKKHREEAERLRAEKAEAVKAAEAFAKLGADARAAQAPKPAGDEAAPWSSTTKPPTSSERKTPAEEWQAYLAEVKMVAPILKSARLALWHDQNIAAAKHFAEAMNRAVREASEIAQGKEEA